jgi:hypothetical protein
MDEFDRKYRHIRMLMGSISVLTLVVFTSLGAHAAGYNLRDAMHMSIDYTTDAFQYYMEVLWKFLSLTS